MRVKLVILRFVFKVVLSTIREMYNDNELINHHGPKIPINGTILRGDICLILYFCSKFLLLRCSELIILAN